MSELFVVLIGIITWGTLLFTVFYKRKDVGRDIPILILVINYIVALIPLGFFFGLYLEESQKKIDGVKNHRYSKKVRMNGRLIWIIGLVSMGVSLYNLNQS